MFFGFMPATFSKINKFRDDIKLEIASVENTGISKCDEEYENVSMHLVFAHRETNPLLKLARTIFTFKIVEISLVCCGLTCLIVGKKVENNGCCCRAGCGKFIEQANAIMEHYKSFY